MAETKGSYHFTAEESESKGTAPNTVVSRGVSSFQIIIYPTNRLQNRLTLNPLWLYCFSESGLYCAVPSSPFNITDTFTIVWFPQLGQNLDPVLLVTLGRRKKRTRFNPRCVCVCVCVCECVCVRRGGGGGGREQNTNFLSRKHNKKIFTQRDSFNKKPVFFWVKKSLLFFLSL